MFLKRLTKPGAAKAAARKLYAATVAEARAPALYAGLGAPDTPDGRFEVYTLLVLLVLERLRAEGESGLAQAYFDTYLSGLDHGLRELAVGDLSVGKTMRRLGAAFYGRGKALDEALAALPDRAPLEALVARTVFAGAGQSRPAPFAARLIELREKLASAPGSGLAAGELPWRGGA